MMMMYTQQGVSSEAAEPSMRMSVDLPAQGRRYAGPGAVTVTQAAPHAGGAASESPEG